MNYLASLVILICLNIPFVPAQVKPSPRQLQIKNTINDNQVKTGILVSKSDSFPLGRYRYYKIDKAGTARYLNSAISKDSVRLEKASKTDWDEFATAYAALQQILRLNPFDNVRNYIDTSKEMVELYLLKQDFLPNTAKVCLRQLTFNINLLNQLLSKPIIEKSDVLVLSAVMNNIDILINKYVATKGVTITKLNGVSLPNVIIKVFDTTGTELTNAKCYFISFKTCRDIACRSCVPGLDPCDDKNISAITNKPDRVFDCTNPVKVSIDFGHYHFFVISKNKIRHYEQMHIDESRLSAEGINQLRINL